MIGNAICEMTLFYKSNLHDIEHFLRVYGFAKAIGEAEKLDSETMTALELAAVFHDIACPLCREKYGSCSGKNQEKEGPALAAPILQRLGCGKETAERVLWLIAHHHTCDEVCAPDHRILLEADYLVNAEKNKDNPECIRSASEKIFKTETGKALLKSIYGI